MHWMTSSKCRTMEPDLFFPAPGESPSVAPEELCAGCPVLAACRTYASNTGNTSGIWGGQLYEDGSIIGGETTGAEGGE